MRLHDFLDFHARERPEAEFAVCRAQRLTYGEAQAEANRLANAFISQGLRLGDRVAIVGKNCLEWAILYYGAAKAGVVPVPLNPRLAPGEWRWIINDAAPRLLIAIGSCLEAVDAL